MFFFTGKAIYSYVCRARCRARESRGDALHDDPSDTLFEFASWHGHRGSVLVDYYKVPLRDVVDVRSRGCRKLQRKNTGDPHVREPT